MKYFFFYMLIATMACNSAKDHRSIEGVYVGHFEHEYGINDDTLIFSKANDGELMFELIRRTGTIRKEPGRQLPKKHSVENYICQYNSETQVLSELRGGMIFIWDSSNEAIRFGRTVYRKL